MTALFSISLVLLCTAPQEPVDANAHPSILIKASRIVVAPGTELKDQAILIRGGKVAFLGREIPPEARRGARVLDFGKKTVVPGFVNPHSHLGLGNDLAERTTAVTPELRATDAFDPFDEALLDEARGGVTTVGLAPLSGNALAGIAGVVKTGDPGKVMADNAYLKIALVSDALDQNRYPTSHMGAIELLRRRFAVAKSVIGAPGPGTRTLRDVLAGSLRVAIHARTHAEISQALDLCEEIGVAPLLIGADEADKSLERIAKQRGSVILAPLHAGDRPRQLDLPAKLEQAGIPFSFMTTGRPQARLQASRTRQRGRGRRFSFSRGSRTPTRPQIVPTEVPANQLRLSAALAVRHGLSREAALAALTRVPAEQLGAGATCGSLRQGCDADFLVFDGDPTDLTSRLEAVHIRGRALELEENER